MTDIAAPFSAAQSTAAQPSAKSAPQDDAHVHPLLHAGRGLASDLLSTLAFALLYGVTHNALASIGLALAAGVGQIVWLKARGRPIDAMQWMSLGLVVVFGGVSLLTHDPRFLMVKPTLIYCAVGAVMLKRGWMNRYIPAPAMDWSADLATGFGYVWSAMMFATAGLNLALAAHGDVKTWALFIAAFPPASKIALFAVQYLTIRAVTVRRMRAAGAAL